jgi:rhodanese-related sulfurtransferase
MIDPSRVPTIDVLEAERRRGAPAEHAATGGTRDVRAEGAILVPLSTFMLRYRELPRDRPLLMICRSGARSGQATGFLLASGWTDVVNVAGGTLAWERAGLPVRRGAPAPGEGELPGEGDPPG